MSTGQLLGAGGGAALGAYLALPTGGVSVGMGALYGMQAGMLAGGYLDPPKGPTQSGPRLSDTAQQTSTYGATIPRVYGTIGVLGNIFWLENNKLKEVVKKKKSGGKGGGSSTTVKTYTYYGTFAVGLCEGPIAGVRRIWVGPDLVYDAGSGDLESIIASNQASSKFSIYLGTADQQPDPRMQAEMGVANCPAYRGLAYIVVKDLLLTKYGNSIQGAPIKAEVVVNITPHTPVEIFHSSSSINTNPARGVVFKGSLSGSIYCSSALSTGGVGQVEFSGVSRNGRAVSIYSAETSYNWPVRSIGFDYAYASNAFTLVTSDGEFSTPASLSNYIEVIKDEYTNHVIIFTSYPGGTAGTIYDASSGVIRSDVNFKGISVDAEFIYSVSGNTGYRLDKNTLSTVSAFDISESSLGSNYAYLSCDNGYLWVSKKNSHSIDSYSLSTLTHSQNISSIPYYSADEVSAVIDGLLIKMALNTKDVSIVNFVELVDSPEMLSGVVLSESLRSGILSVDDIDVSDISDSVVGFKISNIGSIRSAIEPLQGAFPFDVIQSGYTIKAIARGKSSIASIDIGDLGVDEQLRQSREMDTQLPTKIVASYLDRARNYDANEQFWERPTSGAVNTRTMELPIVLGANQALQVVERLGSLYWLERTDFGPFTLPPTFGGLEPGDVITLHAGYADYELRLKTVSYQSDGSLECTGKLNSASLYISAAASTESPDSTPIPLAGSSLYALLDIPVVDETLQNAPGLVAVMTGYTAGWPGGVIYRSPDLGQTWDDIQAFSGKSTVGYARASIGENAGEVISRGDSMTIDLISGELSGVTESQMLNGANIAAYGADGRWEIMRFANAALNGDGSYTIDTFWRGDKGTEWATGLHATGDMFVLLDDPDSAFITVPAEMLGVERTYRGITTSADIDSDTSRAFTYRGANLECLSPVYAAGARSSGDLAVTWTRRSRLSSSWWTTGVVAQLGESTESYEVDVMSGLTVKRMISSATPNITYTAAQQIADFGSAQPSITLRIYQLSSVVGRGLPLEVTL